MAVLDEICMCVLKFWSKSKCTDADPVDVVWEGTCIRDKLNYSETCEKLCLLSNRFIPALLNIENTYKMHIFMMLVTWKGIC